MNHFASLLVLLVGCTPDGPGKTKHDLTDPESCAECHPVHYQQWSGSMHAYASTDPLFRAMNERGQRETNGALGDDCVSCHAPAAVWLGLTTDGLDLADVPDWAQGVTCISCHAAIGTSDEGVPLQLADDGILRAGIANPLKNRVHDSEWSPLHDRDERESSSMCGSCHFRAEAEWNETLFGVNLNCGGCHMRGSDERAATVDHAPIRRTHSHAAPGVDIAITPWPNAEEQRELVQQALNPSLQYQLCVTPSAGLTVVVVTLENQAAGHAWPSCSKDRRAWVEIIARDAAGEVVWSTGAVADDQPLSALDDPDLWAFGDWQRDASGQHVTMPWDAITTDSYLLPARMALDDTDPRWVDPHVRNNWLVDLDEPPATVSMRVRFRPVLYDLIDDLIASGDFDPALRSAFPTYDLEPTIVQWKAGETPDCIPDGVY